MSDLSTNGGSTKSKRNLGILGFNGIGLLLVALAGFAVFSSVLSQPPLYDESYLLAWWAHSISSGLFSADTFGQLRAGPVDLRDGQSYLANFVQLITAIATGTNYGAMRFIQVAMHAISAALLAICILNSDKKANVISGTEPSWELSITSVVAAAVFIIYPLAPEAVGWLGGLPVETATLMTLLGAVLSTHSQAGRQKSIAVGFILLFIAPWISVKVVPLVLFVFVLNGLLAARLGRSRLLAVSISAALSLAIFGSAMIGSANTIPETIRQLKIEKVSATDAVDKTEQEPASGGLLNDCGDNLKAIFLPVNRNIDERYNKVLRRFYFILGAESLVFLAAFALSPAMRALALAAGLPLAFGFLTACGVDEGNFYGARWLYPTLPSAALLMALVATSPLYLKGSGIIRYVKVLCTIVFVCLLVFIFVDRTFKQCSSYKSNGKLWKVVQATVEESGRKQTSPFIIVRNLPQSLSIAPIISPFSPQLLDTQSALPRTTSLSAGAFKDAVKAGHMNGLALHYRQQYQSFLPTEFEAVNKAFGPSLNAVQIADQLSPPLSYYQGTVGLDKSAGLLHLLSKTKMGPAVRMQSLGLSPAQDDFLCVEARITAAKNAESVAQRPNAQRPDAQRPDVPKTTAQMELHWLTNWQGDFDSRDRKIDSEAFVIDGQLHKYYFPLRTLAWLTSGLPTDIMLGFPRNTVVDLKSVSVVRNGDTATNLNYQHLAMPRLSARAVKPQNNNKLYFSHYCFDYPDKPELGLCAVYGSDNSLELDYDVSTIDGAASAKIEFAPSLETLPVEKTIDCPNKSGRISVKSTALGGGRGGIYSVRVRARDRDGNALGPVSDSLKVLLDPDL